MICAPLLGLNIGIHRGFLDAQAPARPARVWPKWVAEPWDHLRYDLRRPLPEAAAALSALAGARRLILLTGRRSAPTVWLRRHNLDRYFEQVIINDGSLRSPHFKLRAVKSLGAKEHVDDDPRTAQLLAEASNVDIYLRDWPRNRDLPYHARVTRVTNLAALAARLTGAAPAPP